MRDVWTEEMVRGADEKEHQCLHWAPREADTISEETAKEESGFQALMSELEERQGVESAYAFLSGKVKDRGAIGASLKLHKKAMQVEPTNSSFALDYVHLLELSQDFMAVVEFAQAFCSRCRETPGRDLELREIVRGVDGVGALFSDTPLAFYGKEPWDPLDAAKSEAKDGVEEIVQQVEFSSPQLDLMALIFTLMKVLFVGGALDRVSKLVNVIELARKAPQKELHTTLIRNEYDSDAEAIETTVDIYIKLLLRLVRERHFEIFIHPISPVLDVTRPVVKSYMSCLKRKALDAIQEHSLVVHWQPLKMVW